MIASFLRNAQPEHDTLTVDKFSIDDLDRDSLIAFKEHVNKRFPKKDCIEMSNDEFLTEIGACIKDRTTGKLKLKRGIILFLGKVNAIKELYPHFHLDYYNRRGDNPRWAD